MLAEWQTVQTMFFFGCGGGGGGGGFLGKFDLGLYVWRYMSKFLEKIW